MRVAGGSVIRRYFNEELVWVEPQNMPQALYLQLLGFLIYKGITEGERRMEQQAMQENVQEYKIFEEDPESKAFRHTSSHVLAQAVKRLFPEAKLGIGPAIDYGFYYDFDLEHKFTEEDLAAIEKEMKKITKANILLERFELPREEAIKFMEEKGEPYKVELIKDLPEDEVISFYKQGEFTDLCAGPHKARRVP